MVTIQFFDDADLADVSVIRIFSSETAQNNYFGGLECTEIQGAFKGFEEPMLINSPLEDAIGHTYGRFQVGTKWYYFYVTDVRQDTHGKTWLSYRLDHWETAREQFGVTLGRGYVTRSSAVQPCATPYDAKYNVLTGRTLAGRHNRDVVPCDIVFAARDHVDNQVYYGYISCGSGYFQSQEMRALLDGSWPTYIKLPLHADQHFNTGDILGCWFSPPIATNFPSSGWERMYTTSSYYFENKGYISKPDFITFGFVESISGTFLTGSQLSGYMTDPTHTAVFMDMDGNIIKQLDFSRTISEDLTAYLVVSMTSAKWIVHNADKSIEFTIPCSGMDYFIESESEYFARDRQFDLDTRELNNKKDLVSGITSGAANAVSGAIGGAVIGSAVPILGTGLGAAAGAISGLVGSGAGVAVNSYFNPQEQAIKDAYIKNSLDRLSMVGSNNSYYLMMGSYHCGISQYEYDADTKARVLDDVSNFGHYTTKAVASGESLITSNNARLKGEFVVNGLVPESWKGAIQQRFASGIIVKVMN